MTIRTPRARRRRAAPPALGVLAAAIAAIANRAALASLATLATLIALAVPPPARAQADPDCAAPDAGAAALDDSAAVALADTAANPFRRIMDLYQVGITARQAHDCLRYQRAMERALTVAPGHPILMNHLARALARQGQYDLAEAWLDSVAATGAVVDLEADADFAGLRASEAFRAVVARMAANRQPQGEAQEAFALKIPDLLPEGIARDAESGALYLGSIRLRKILRLGPDGSVADFVREGQDGLCSVVGLTVDPLRRVLWACSAADPGMAGATPADTSRTGVFGWSLDDGELVGAFLLPDSTVRRQLNDLAIGPLGRIYASDSQRGAVWRLDPDAGAWEVLLADGEVPGANGLAFSPDGRRLYVSAYALGVAVVDLDDAQAVSGVRRLACPATQPAVFIDGLYCRGNSLFAVQNWLGMARVTRFWLDTTGTEVTGAEVLLSHHPRFDEPTTAALAEDELFVVANSELHRYAPDGTLAPADKPPRFVVLRLPY